MPIDWESFKCHFRTKSANSRRYNQLRAPVAEAIDEVNLILEARGAGDLPSFSLETIELAHMQVRQKLLNADSILRTSRSQAVELIQALAPEATKLLESAVAARAKAEQAERLRRQQQKDYEDALDNAMGLLDSIDKMGAPRPTELSENLLHGMSTLVEMTELGNWTGALEVLNGLTEGLEELEEGMAELVELRKRTPTELETADERDIKRWDAAVITAIEDGKPEQLFDPLTAYEAWLTESERVRGVEDVIRGKHPKERFEQLTLRIDDILDYPKEFSSPALKAKRMGVKQAVGVVKKRLKSLKRKESAAESAKKKKQQKQAAANRARTAANTAVDDLITAIDDAVKLQKTHDVAMRTYYAELKKLKPRIQLADSLPLQVNGSDAPWKDQKDDFVAQRKKVTDAVDPKKRDYVTGLAELRALVLVINTLVRVKLVALKSEVATATDSTSGSASKVITLMTEIVKSPGLIKAMGGKEQLAMLEMLRKGMFACTRCDKNFTESQFTSASKKCPFCKKNDQLDIPAHCDEPTCLKPCNMPALWSSSNRCPDCNGSTWDYSTDFQRAQWNGVVEEHPNAAIAIARARILGEMDLTPEFQLFDQEKRQEVIEAVRLDPVFQNMTEEQWGNWVDEGAPYTKIVQYATSVLKTQCGIYGHDQTGLMRDGETFTDIPVKIEVKHEPKDPETAGYCKPGFPTWLVLNSASPMFRDFKEVVDTIVHENSHAFQEMLIKKLKAEAPFDGSDRDTLLLDPKLALQAQLFLENDESYISRSSLKTDGDVHEDLADKAYRHEPLEEHAWTVGGKISRALLVPPPPESFRSSHTMRSKTFHVVTLVQGDKPNIKVRERHGIYVDEWEGETAWDKKLFLDGVPKDGKRKTKKVEIEDVIDAFTLKLDWDSTDYDEDEDNAGFVRSDGMRLRLDERVQDL